MGYLFNPYAAYANGAAQLVSTNIFMDTSLDKDWSKLSVLFNQQNEVRIG